MTVHRDEDEDAAWQRICSSVLADAAEGLAEEPPPPPPPPQQQQQRRRHSEAHVDANSRKSNSNNTTPPAPIFSVPSTPTSATNGAPSSVTVAATTTAPPSATHRRTRTPPTSVGPALSGDVPHQQQQQQQQAPPVLSSDSARTRPPGIVTPSLGSTAGSEANAVAPVPCSEGGLDTSEVVSAGGYGGGIGAGSAAGLSASGTPTPTMTPATAPPMVIDRMQFVAPPPATAAAHTPTAAAAAAAAPHAHPHHPSVHDRAEFTETHQVGGGGRGRQVAQHPHSQHDFQQQQQQQQRRELAALNNTNTALAMQLSRSGAEVGGLKEALERARHDICTLKGELKVTKTKAALKVSEVMHLKADYATLLEKHQQLVNECCDLQRQVHKHEKQLRAQDRRDTNTLRQAVGESVRHPLRDRATRESILKARGRSSSGTRAGGGRGGPAPTAKDARDAKVAAANAARERERLSMALARAENKNQTLEAEAAALKSENEQLKRQHVALSADLKAARGDREEYLKLLRMDPALRDGGAVSCAAVRVLQRASEKLVPPGGGAPTAGGGGGDDTDAGVTRALIDLEATLRGMRDLWSPGGADYVSPAVLARDGVDDLRYHLTVEERRLATLKRLLDTHTQCATRLGQGAPLVPP